jgi:hypothetical protein
MISLIILIFLSPIFLTILLIDLIIWIVLTPLYFLSLKADSEFVKRYLFNIFVSRDQSVNALLWGDQDETISSRFGRRWPGSWVAKLLNKIFGAGHVQQAVEPDEGKDDLIK